MNEEDYPERPSGFLLGKEFIVVLVIVFSGISFTLGYFVGKNTAGTAPAPPLLAVETTQQTRPDAQPPLPAQPPLQQPVNAAAADAVPAPPGQPASAPVASEKHAGNAAVAAPQVQQKSANTVAAGPDKAAARSTAEPGTSEKPKVFTVQIGAFKSIAEARQLKAKFEKKGYKPFISVVKDRKGTKIYKVKTGEFPDRKDAEVLALKLKKTEALHTYVTTKSE
ncbi:MAG: SPOR domain-containing protein [Nitrospirae bacterium]|nr:SPOR domain-containing protein [Nitrospirota bacterium]